MIKIGPAGSSGLGHEKGIEEIAKIGLNSLEVEFTYGVRMSIPEAKKVGEIAEKQKIFLSVHAPYYINLASEETKKIEASKKRILMSCERGHYFAWKEPTPIVFHAGFYQGRDKEKIFQIIKEQIIKLQKEIKQKKWNVILCPETTGKASQFGDIDELLKLSKETGCSLCVDFAHLKARNNGKIDYDEIFEKIKNIKHIHSHFSGIEYTAKGERRHLITEVKDIKELIGYIKKYKIDITIINESPDPIADCRKTKQLI
jgi:deoxyribonuclease-4